VLPIREWIVNDPQVAQDGDRFGIGRFPALIALKNAGIVVGDKATLVTHGQLTSFRW
jgi:AGZA family xanthine/uracil permease-like MFS transporter